MHRGCFVWTPTPPLAGRRTPRPGPVCVYLCSSFLARLSGPASRARSGAPALFLRPLCLSALLGPLRAWIAPFLVLCLPSLCSPQPFFVFFFCLLSFLAHPLCLLLSFWFSAPGAFGLGALFFFPSPPRPWVFVMCAPFVSGLIWFPAPAALGLGAVCCLFCWPPASLLPVLSRLVCVSRLAVGCSLLFAVPPPLSCLVVFVAASQCSVFFLLCASVVSGFRWFPAPGALGLGAVGCLFCWLSASLLSVRSRLVCLSRLAVGCSLVVAAPPPPPPFCRAGFVARCSFSFSLLRFAPLLSLPLLSRAFSDFRPRVSWALALCAVCFVGLPLLGSLCTLASFVFPA